MAELDAIWISHLHLDHVGDLLNAYYALAYGQLPALSRPVPVYAPAALGARIAGFFEQPDAGFVGDVLELRPLHDGHVLELGGLTVTSRLVDHGIEAYGLRASADGHTLAYSGDCAPCSALDELADGVDLLLCEVDSDTPTEVHHTPEQAGALARRTGVGRLVVTHVGPSLVPSVATARAAEVFGGPTVCAEVGETLSPW
ncbi:ribonuclease BN (tRNA processing enzyme) [Kribbella amoyensis]|uniref:Ribonuclease BN (tRNA processing enzyme) n=2 Tax=Kribbella amoyensis TaxID=996641 RepID=A0A561BPP4_9ACTN|nr:ribonuclease BN (tRNA processing enzyme) [Kribbella amoyensis]